VDLLVGLDVSTAQVRAMAVGPRGQVLGFESAALPAPLRTADNRVEQDPVYAAVAIEVLGRLIVQLSEPIAAICVTATSGTIVPTDAAGRPMGRAIMYNDARGTAGAIAWLQRHLPAVKYLHVSDVVLARLAGGILSTDTSHALKAGADPVSLDWPADVLSTMGVSHDQLPALARPGTIAGVTCSKVAEGPFAAGIPLVLGMTDGCTGQIAAGSIAIGQSVSVLGTTLVTKVVSRSNISTRDGAVYSHRSPDGLWWAGGASNVGAAVLAQHATPHEFARLSEAAERHGPATHLHYPLTEPGERFPFRSDAAHRFVSGTPMNRVDHFRGLLEGVAFVERLGYEVLAEAGAPYPDTVRSVGGGSSNPSWRRVRASVLNRLIETLVQPSSAFGAAVLAASTTVHDGLADAAAHMVRLSTTTEPVREETAALEHRYAEFVAELERRGWLSLDRHAHE
jgi:sugar (pentulose or hexulose) kinase